MNRIIPLLGIILLLSSCNNSEINSKIIQLENQINSIANKLELQSNNNFSKLEDKIQALEDEVGNIVGGDEYEDDIQIIYKEMNELKENLEWQRIQLVNFKLNGN